MSTFPGKSVHRWIPSRTIHLPPVQLEDVRVYQHRRGYGQDEVRGGCSCCTKRATDVATFTQCPRNIAPLWHKDITVTAKNLAPDRIWRHKKDTVGPRQNLILSKNTGVFRPYIAVKRVVTNPVNTNTLTYKILLRARESLAFIDLYFAFVLCIRFQ